jgi:hypothetical protein
MHDQQPGTSAFTAVGAPQLNTVTNLPEVRSLVHLCLQLDGMY